MDLGSVQSVAAITSWSFRKGHRGAQKVALYGSASVVDPGWDLSAYTPLGMIDTTDLSQATYTAASLRALDGQTIGQFRWIVWAVSPVTAAGENSAFQELAVELR
ncbi:hypothetical protein SH580_21315 [Coraliomargarita algicola]|uniref:Uncharacterized protein n=1 Tax=Coraliomargarita algicola TaxID=3092156 RepID=A0ABZ0RSL7_9BACT|nr:hypothetical protein [Coraliomargarita sp. J2-16]WPJ95959.1 hypothetical protein SH580_21315 [Coraliomargarita sp. J2-16]